MAAEALAGLTALPGARALEGGRELAVPAPACKSGYSRRGQRTCVWAWVSGWWKSPGGHVGTFEDMGVWPWLSGWPSQDQMCFLLVIKVICASDLPLRVSSEDWRVLGPVLLRTWRQTVAQDKLGRGPFPDPDPSHPIELTLKSCQDSL